MKKYIIFFSLLPLYFSSQAQHTNVKISSINSPEEPSICLNYLNTNYIVAGANLKNYYYSDDAGLTWTQNALISSFGVSGDPCIVSDKYGSFYYLHLSSPAGGSWLDRIVCQKSTDNGVTWNDGSYMGDPGTKDHDKQWAAIDFNNNNIYVTWTIFDVYGSSNSNHKSNILFSKSTNKGMSWTNPVQINQFSGDCFDDDYTTEGAVPAVGPNGEIYVAWAFDDKIYFDKSIDKGETWMDEDILVGSQPGGWNYSIPGIQRCNGLPITCCDTSNSLSKGNIYINWTDQRNGTDNTDVWFAKSIDGGETWSEAKKVNDDEGSSHQFFTWMTVDQWNGNIYFVFYDRRNHSDNTTDVYMAVSKDGGETFENFKVSEEPFLPNSSVFFGDYNNITAYKNVVRPIWTRLNYDSNESGLSIWTAIVNTDSLGIDYRQDLIKSNSYLYPNPSGNLCFYSFKLKEKSQVNLSLYNSNGQLVKQLINEERKSGKYIESIDINSEKMKSGIYFFSLRTNHKRALKKLIVVE